MNKRFSYCLFSLAILFFIGTNLHAQYSGGKGDGYDMAELTTDISSGNTDSISVTLFPNLIDAGATMQLYLTGISGEIQVKAFDAIGRMVFEFSDQPSQNWAKYNITSTLLASGEYILRITSGDHSFTQKFIVNDH